MDHNLPPTRTVRLPVDLIHKAQKLCWRHARRPAEQLEYWIRLGLWHAHSQDLAIPPAARYDPDETEPPHPDHVPDYFDVRSDLQSLRGHAENRAEWDTENAPSLREIAKMARALAANLNEKHPESLVAGQNFYDANVALIESPPDFEPF